MDPGAPTRSGARRASSGRRSARRSAARGRCVCISEATRTDLVARFPAASGKAVVAPLAADPRFFAAPDEAGIASLRARHELRRPFVLAAGTLEPRKNLTRLLAAYAQLPDALREAHELVIVGPGGWEMEETLRAARAGGDDVRLLGHVSDADLALLYGSCAAFAYPSLYEGFGLPVLEAMAAGAAVLTSSSSSPARRSAATPSPTATRWTPARSAPGCGASWRIPSPAPSSAGVRRSGRARSAGTASPATCSPRPCVTRLAAMAPLVSVLLPTRNRLEYLKIALQTVIRQDDGDWEVVVSDNDSTEDIEGHVRELGDPRIRYVRTAAFVPVTENWNTALEHSTGDHVVMLGDDDGLLPGFVAAIRALSERFERPDVIYTGACLFAYPGVIPEFPGGYVQPYSYARFFRDRTDPFVLAPDVARSLVDDAMAFRVRYGFNMQFSTVSRALIERLSGRGPFFQSAFPDYYATNAAFLTARRIVIDPAERVAIGITPKSYGYFHANRREDEGREFLGAAPDEATRELLERELLPGTNINAGWLSALASLSARFGAEYGLRIDLRRFRILQAEFVYEQWLSGEIGDAELDELRARLRPRELRTWDAAAKIARTAGRVVPPVGRRAARHGVHRWVLRQTPYWNPPRETGYATLLDLFERRAWANSSGIARSTTSATP